MSEGTLFPVMSEEELASVTVRFEDASSRLADVLASEGVAIVTGVCSPDECAELQVGDARVCVRCTVCVSRPGATACVPAR